MFPTAETTPQGDFEISDYELFLLTLAYGVTNELQLSLTGILPIIEGQPLFLWFTGKYAVFRNDTIVFSPLLSFDWFSDSGDSVLLLTVGTLLDVVLGDRGQGAVSFGLTGSFLLASPDVAGEDLDTWDNSAILIETAFTWEVASFVKLLVEIVLPAALVDGEFDVAEGVLINYGVRFFNDLLAGDIGFVKPVGDGEDDFILGFPLAAFSVRF